MTKPPSALLLINTGSPAQATLPAITDFLQRFFADRQIFRLSPPLHFVLRTLVPRLRARKLLPRYQVISLDGTSAQHYYLPRLCQALQSPTLTVAYAFLYAPPYLPYVLEHLQQQGIDKLYLLPLYPQDSGTTVGSAQVQVDAALKALNFTPKLTWITDYGTHPHFIAAISAHLQQTVGASLQDCCVYFSYHALPEAYLKDKREAHYIKACLQCSQLIAAHCGLNTYHTVFQSALGPMRWHGPFLEQTILEHDFTQRPAVVITPGFAIDCLETLGEVAQETAAMVARKKQAHFSYVPCLNDTPLQQAWIKALLAEKLIDGRH